MKMISEYQYKKQQLIDVLSDIKNDGELINALADPGIVDKLSVHISSIENEEYFVSITGQMKCGKSTLLNALIFNNDILPTDVNTATAKLTLIKYNEVPKFEVSFYTTTEWEDLKKELQGGEEKTSYYTKYIEPTIKQTNLSVHQFLDKTLVDDDFRKLDEYISKDGLYTPLVNSVTIYYPSDLLKNVVFVDTPGVNDPNPIRDRVTKTWIQKTTASIFVMYAGSVFQEADREFGDEYLFDIPDINKVTVINKIDLLTNYNEDIKAIQGRLASIRDNIESQYHLVTADDKSTVYTSGIYALISSMKEAELDIDQYGKELNDVRRLKFLKPELNNVLELRKIIESKILANKAEGFLQREKEFIAGIFSKATLEIQQRIANLEEKKSDYLCTDQEILERIKDCDLAKSKIREVRSGIEADINVSLRKKIDGLIDDIILDAPDYASTTVGEVVKKKVPDKALYITVINVVDSSIRKKLKKIAVSTDGIVNELKDLIRLKQITLTTTINELAKGYWTLSIDFADKLATQRLDIGFRKVLDGINKHLDEKLRTLTEDPQYKHLFLFLKKKAYKDKGFQEELHRCISEFYEDFLSNEINNSTAPIRTPVDNFITESINELEKLLKQKSIDLGEILNKKENIENEIGEIDATISKLDLNLQQITEKSVIFNKESIT